jgi:hypothetical protein
MNYLKSYGLALFELIKVLGAIFLISSFFYGNADIASFLVYLCLGAALAGPISTYIGGSDDKKHN